MRIKLVLIVASVLVAAGVPAFAHHSFSAEYDSTKQRTFTGIVTKLEWTNPHARFYVDVKDDAGAVTNWEFEIGAPALLMRNGWTRNSLKPGDQIVVEGFLAKDGANLANARTVKTIEGKKLFAGSSSENEATK
jgi:hypothetical protein